MNNKNGFTLVELIMVMVIVGILTASIPRFVDIVRQSNGEQGILVNLVVDTYSQEQFIEEVWLVARQSI